MKLLFCTLGLLVMTAPTLAQTENAPKTPHEIYYSKSQTTADGLTIAPMSTEDNYNDDMAVMLQVNKWRYFTKPNKADMRLNYSLEFRRPGREVQHLTSRANTPLSVSTEFTLAIMPDKGDIYSDDKYRTFVRQRDLDSNLSSTGVQDALNPLKGLTFTYSPSSDPSQGKINADGSIVLWSFNTGEAEANGKSQLVLVLTAAKPPEPQ